MASTPIRAVALDFDGTIVESKSQTVAAINSVAAEFGFEPMAESDIDDLRRLGMRHYCRYKLGIHSLLAGMKFQKKTQANYASRLATLKLVDGMPEVIRQLQSDGIPVAVVSSNKSRGVPDYLETHGITGLFSVETGGNYSAKDRLLCKVVKGLRKSFGIKPAEVIYVGDETRDAEAAIRASIGFAGVNWGLASRHLLSEPQYKARIVLNQPSSLLTWLEEVSRG